MAIPPCSHLMSNHDGSLVVGDGVPHSTGDIQFNDPFIWKTTLVKTALTTSSILRTMDTAEQISIVPASSP